MAKLYIREYQALAVAVHGAAQVGQEPGVDQTPVVIDGTSRQSAAFAATTKFVRVETDVICSIVFATDPTATANNARMAADQAEYFGVNAGDKIAVITNT